MRALSTALFACFGISLPAQTVVAPHSNGPLVGVPSMFSLATETSGPGKGDSSSDGLHKPVGFSTAAAVPLTPASGEVPDFSARAMFREACGIKNAPLPDVDAWSLGLDWITVERGGVVRVPPGNWSGIVFSVTRGSKAKSGQILGETTRTDKNARAAADQFSFIYRGSALPPVMVDVTQRSNDATELRVPTDREIDAIDIYAPIYRLAADRSLKLPAPRIYFSVSASTLSRVPSTWWSGKPKSGATIFTSTWDTTKKKWRCPKGLFSPRDLGLRDSEDVDALSYDSIQGKILISTTTKSRNPLLYVDPSADFAVAVPVVYSGGGTKLVTDSIGIDSSLDDIDAICSYDPGAARGVRLDLVMGRLLPPSPPRQLTLDLQALRDVDAQNPQQRFLRFLGVGGQPRGFAFLLLAPPNSNNWFAPFPVVQIPPTSQHDGMPIELHVPIPRQSRFTQFDCAWFSIPNQITGQFKISHRMRVQFF